MIVLVVVYVIVGHRPRQARARADRGAVGSVRVCSRSTWPPATGPRTTATPCCRALAGTLLFNRLFWLAARRSACWPLAYPALPARRAAAAGRGARRSTCRRDAVPASHHRSRVVQPRFDRRAALAQLVARTRFDMALVFRSPVFWILLGLGLVNAAGDLWTLTDDGRYGAAPLAGDPAADPGARRQLHLLRRDHRHLLFAGELVWRDRDRRTHEIIDATPVARLDVHRPQDAGHRPGAGRHAAGRRRRRRARPDLQGLLRLRARRVPGLVRAAQASST